MRFPVLSAEFIGTFALTFIGMGAIASAQAGLLGVAMAHGLVIAVMATAFIPISGGHFNPAVSLAMLATGRLSAGETVGYVLAQCLGAIAAAFAAVFAFGRTLVEQSGFGMPALATGVSPAQGFLIEFLATFFLVTVIFGTCVDKRAPKMGGLFIGFAVVMGILGAGTFTGGALNTARWLGSAVAGGGFADSWVYIAGPILGGVVAALFSQTVMLDRDAEAQS